jgi:exosortase H (IPTLxxWG-CTERM-specific)
MKYSTASLSDKIKENHTLLTFGMLFVFFCTAFYAITRLTPSTFTPLNNYTTTTLGFLLRLLGMHPTVEGALLSAGGFSVKIIDECSALFVFILFSSFVLAYPTTFKNKAIGLIFGIPSLFVVNTLRLTVVFFAGLWRPDLFEYVHAYLWQTIMIILVFISCLAWLHYVVMVTTRNAPLAFLVRFVAFSSVLFLIWFYLDNIYVSMTGYMTEFLLNCMGYHIHLAPDPNIALYPSTFNLIAFTALILATQSPRISRRGTKIKALAIGLTLMMLVEVIHGLYQVLADFGVGYALEIMYAAQIGNQYFLPFGLWLAFSYADVFRRAGAHICPICGEEKVGIVEHIRVKHGEEALEREDVKAMLEARRGVFWEKMRSGLVMVMKEMKNKFKAMLKKEE